MRTTRTARMVALAGAAALVVGLAGQTTAEAAPTVTVDSVTFSSPTMTVSGLGTVAQTVTAHIVNPDAAPVAPLPNSVEWVFEMTATGGSGTLREIDVIAHSTAGTEADGTWSATVHVPSTADGTWTLSRADACGTGVCTDGHLVVTLTSLPTFTVTGHHQPRLTVGMDPLPYPSTSMMVKGRVVDADTGLGMPGVVIGYGFDTNCIQFFPDAPIRFLVEKKTNAGGYYSFGPVIAWGLQCVGVWGSVHHNSDSNSIFPAFRAFHPTTLVKPAVMAAPTSTRGKVGTPLAVNGTVRATVPGGIHLVVQQLRGRTAWRAVAYTTVRASGRWSSAVIPTTEGPRNVYRVVSMPTPAYVVGTSKAFVVTGTCLHKGCSYTLGTTPPPPW